MPPVKGTNKKVSIFHRDENVLPFFSWHDKTKVGVALRIALVAFMGFVVLISIAARYVSVTLASASTFYPLTYIIPLAIVAALIVLGLFKRMRSTFSRILVGLVAAMVLLIGVSLVSSYLNLMPLMLLSQNEVSLPKKYAALQVNCDGKKQNLVLMHQYGRPDGSYERKTETGADDLVCPFKVDGVKITVSAANSEECIATGALYVRSDEIEKLAVEWLDEDTARIYVSEDASALIPQEMIGTAEVTGNYQNYRYVFADTSFMSSLSAASDGSGQRVTGIEGNEREGHKLNIYRTDVTAYQATSIYQMSPESLKQVYTAYPSLLFNLLIKTDVKTEGEITVEPYGTVEEFQLLYDKENDSLTVRPSGASSGADGEIVLHLNEKVDVLSAQEAASPEPADPPAEQKDLSGYKTAYNEIIVHFQPSGENSSDPSEQN